LPKRRTIGARHRRELADPLNPETMKRLDRRLRQAQSRDRQAFDRLDRAPRRNDDLASIPHDAPGRARCIGHAGIRLNVLGTETHDEIGDELFLTFK
jgi:hypothetical protein